MSIVIIGTGHDLPECIITNDELEMMDLDFDRARAGGISLNEWAMQRIGVRERHYLQPGEGTSDMGTRAARRALDAAQLSASDLDLIIMSTMSSDTRAPSSASHLQTNLGTSCKFFQIDAACPGFVDSLIAAEALLNYMDLETALVVSADANSLFSAPDNFMTRCLFGDGGGAVILRRQPDSPYGIKARYTAGTGKGAKIMWVPAGGAKEPLTPESLAAGRQYAQWDPKKVYPFAVEKLSLVAREVVQQAGWHIDEVNWFIPHQTGRNIILDTSRLLNLPEEKFIINIDHTGNTSGASIPIALDEANRAGTFKDGDKIVLGAMGGGLGWAAVALVWYDYRSEAQ